MSTFNYKGVLLITYNRNNISKELHVCGVSSLGSAYTIHIYGMVMNIRFNSSDFAIIRDVHCVESKRSLCGSLCMLEYPL